MEHEPKARALLGLVLTCSVVLAASSDKAPSRAESQPFLVTLTLRDETSVSGGLVGFARGYFVLKTRQGELTIPADRVEKLTPLESLTPPAEPWQPGPLSEEGQKHLESTARDRGRQLVEGIREPRLPARHTWAFRITAGIALAAGQLHKPKLPFEIIDEARQAEITRTGERRCVLIACEAVAHEVLGDKDKCEEAVARLPNHGVGDRVRHQLSTFLYGIELMKQWRGRPGGSKPGQRPRLTAPR